MRLVEGRVTHCPSELGLLFGLLTVGLADFRTRISTYARSLVRAVAALLLYASSASRLSQIMV
jgi:hypothetical protein